MKTPNSIAAAVICPEHDQVFLTLEQYEYQMDRPNRGWICPKCGDSAQFDDEFFEALLGID